MLVNNALYKTCVIIHINGDIKKKDSKSDKTVIQRYPTTPPHVTGIQDQGLCYTELPLYQRRDLIIIFPFSGQDHTH